jgi:hypothetical protein
MYLAGGHGSPKGSLGVQSTIKKSSYLIIGGNKRKTARFHLLNSLQDVSSPRIFIQKYSSIDKGKVRLSLKKLLPRKRYMECSL